MQAPPNSLGLEWAQKCIHAPIPFVPVKVRAHSSIGRAPSLLGGGWRFKSFRAHHPFRLVRLCRNRIYLKLTKILIFSIRRLKIRRRLAMEVCKRDLHIPVSLMGAELRRAPISFALG
jgi:hypothetical protein